MTTRLAVLVEQSGVARIGTDFRELVVPDGAVVLGGEDGPTTAEVSDDLAVDSGVLSINRTRAIVHPVMAAIAVPIADLAAADVSAVDGDNELSEGMRVLVAAQNDDTENGVYVVGVVTEGVAPLTRAFDWAEGQAIVPGSLISVTQGDHWGGSLWKTFSSGTIGEDGFNPWPQHDKGTTALVSGTPSTKALDTLWIRDGAHVSLTGIGVTATLAAELVSGRGDGELSIEGPDSSTASVLYCITNW